MVYAIEDLKRAATLGVRGALMADEGLLLLTRKMKEKDLLLRNFVAKCSVQMTPPNPVSVRLIQDLGANTFDANGATFITNAVTPEAPQKFCRLHLQ